MSAFWVTLLLAVMSLVSAHEDHALDQAELNQYTLPAEAYYLCFSISTMLVFAIAAMVYFGNLRVQQSIATGRALKSAYTSIREVCGTLYLQDAEQAILLALSAREISTIRCAKSSSHTRGSSRSNRSVESCPHDLFVAKHTFSVTVAILLPTVKFAAAVFGMTG